MCAGWISMPVLAFPILCLSPKELSSAATSLTTSDVVAHYCNKVGKCKGNDNDTRKHLSIYLIEFNPITSRCICTIYCIHKCIISLLKQYFFYASHWEMLPTAHGLLRVIRGAPLFKDGSWHKMWMVSSWFWTWSQWAVKSSSES